jgi:hypothetical protein
MASDYVARVYPDPVKIDHGDAVHFKPEEEIKDAGIGYEGTEPETLNDRFNFILGATFAGAGIPGIVPDPIVETGRVLSDNGDWIVVAGGGAIPVFGGAGSDGLVPDPVAENGYVLYDDGSWAVVGDVVGPGSSTNNAIVRYDGTSGTLLQNSLVTISDNGDIEEVNTIQFDITPTSTTSNEGEVHWNATDQTLDIHTKWDTTLQVGQEDLVIIYNGTGVEIPNGTPVYPVAPGPNGRPSMAPAKADIHSNFAGELLVTTAAIAHGAEGPATRFGRVRDVNTNALSLGTVWLSATVAGGLTNTRPAFPNYAIQIGGVTNVGVSDGELLLALKGDATDTVVNFWNGVFRESFDFLVTESGGTVTGTLTPTNGHPDMTMMFSDGMTMLDTDPGATIVLTPGTDTNPQMNYVYIPKTTKVLTVSTSAWPSAEHIKVATVVLKSGATTGTDGGALRNQNYNDHIQSTTSNQGHLSHMGAKLRQFEAQWDSGAAGSSVVTGSPDEVYVAATSGSIYQMHSQTFPAQDTQTGDDVHIVNDSVAPFKTLTDIAGQTLDALGVSLNNKSFSFVLWGICNKTGEQSHLMINLPTGGYSKNFPDQGFV